MSPGRAEDLIGQATKRLSLVAARTGMPRFARRDALHACARALGRADDRSGNGQTDRRLMKRGEPWPAEMSRPAQGRYDVGSVTTNEAPRRASLPTAIVPPCASTMRFEMLRPRP